MSLAHCKLDDGDSNMICYDMLRGEFVRCDMYPLVGPPSGVYKMKFIFLNNNNGVDREKEIQDGIKKKSVDSTNAN